MSAVLTPVAELALPATRPAVVVHKFGGSSVQDAAAIRQVLDIVTAETASRNYVVVSAARGTTDALLACIEIAARKGSWQAALTRIRRRQSALIRHTLGAGTANPLAAILLTALQDDIARLRDLARATALLGTVTTETRDAVAAHGELWSMHLLCAALQMRGIAAVTLDARRFLRAQHTADGIVVDWPACTRLLADCTNNRNARVFVVPGFIAGRREDAITLTLGRNGSDWSATILARLVRATEVTIWSDVPGVLDADPRVVTQASPRKTLCTADAQALAEHGARVLHPATLAPLRGRDVRLAVRCTFAPDSPGTVIHDQPHAPGLTIAARPTVADSSATAISALGQDGAAAPALATLLNARLTPQDFLAQPGQVRAVLDTPHAERAQRIWHRALCRKQRGAALLVIGTGKVGRALLQQLAGWRTNDDVRLLGVANSRHCRLNPAGLSPAGLSRLLRDTSAPALDQLGDFLLNHGEGAPIIVDATASADTAAWHARWLTAGIHVVTANKLAAAQGDVYTAISNGVCYGDSATVGAGLPVLHSVRRLCAAGDRITSIEGILSGSLAYLFHALQRKQDITQALAAAVRNGYTEPDPRVDLTGEDVARKLAIIARAAGLALPTVPGAEPVLPQHLLQLPAADFQARLAEYNDDWRERCAVAEREKRVLRYVAHATADGVATVGVRACKRQELLAYGNGTDNIVIIRSAAYQKTPLVIRGPGAGPALTARALLADIGEILDRYG